MKSLAGNAIGGRGDLTNSCSRGFVDYSSISMLDGIPCPNFVNETNKVRRTKQMFECRFPSLYYRQNFSAFSVPSK